VSHLCPVIRSFSDSEVAVPASLSFLLFLREFERITYMGPFNAFCSTTVFYACGYFSIKDRVV